MEYKVSSQFSQKPSNEHHTEPIPSGSLSYHHISPPYALVWVTVEEFRCDNRIPKSLNQPTPWSWDILEEFIVSFLLEKFLAFYITKKNITIFTECRSATSSETLANHEAGVVRILATECIDRTSFSMTSQQGTRVQQRLRN
jgi:hypothetical protein